MTWLVAVVLASASSVNPLVQLSGSIEALVKQVSPTVVQVVVAAYTTVDQGNRAQADLVMGRQRSIGSGVVIDAGGYIVTNGHVVDGARAIQVVIPGEKAGRGRTVDAKIVGIAREIDLALLKVDVTGLPALPLAAPGSVRQGERDSVTMGVVSATDRQPDPDAPMVYIQTDTPINHGNSGGPLVNVKGELVGINTFILSNSGGSEGLGFAIPSSLVALAYPKLRQFGHLHRGEMGMVLQTLTPKLAAGLALARDAGVIVADVVAGGAAERAGIQIGDVLVSVDGQPIDNVLPLAMRLFTSNGDERVSIGVVRGERAFTTDVAVVARTNDLDRLTDLLDPETSAVPELGILGIAITEEIAPLLPALRAPVGVIVAAHAPQGGAADVVLLTGDVIHSVNGVRVATLAALRALMAAVRAHNPIVLQIERNGQLQFLTFDAS